MAVFCLTKKNNQEHIMDKTAVKFIGFGSLAYAIFAFGVINFAVDNPEDMRWDDREAYNAKYINKLSLDDEITTKQIIKSLGSPDITEAKVASGHNYQVMFYRTQHKQSDGMTTKDECTPFLFKDGVLFAWGEGAYEQYTNIEF